MNQVFRNRFRVPFSGSSHSMITLQIIHHLQSTIKFTVLGIEMNNCLFFYLDHCVNLAAPRYLEIWRPHPQSQGCLVYLEVSVCSRDESLIQQSHSRSKISLIFLHKLDLMDVLDQPMQHMF